MKLTNEQTEAIAVRGKVIVSASAGSGKTFVMIQKLVDLIAAGGDLDEVLAVTFTKKAAAQMKEKLRSAMIARLENAGDERERLKVQLSKISSADISTIHSFCARLIRKYFYALGVNSDFDIISADDAVAQELKKRALDEVFERRYERNDGEFLHLLKRFMKKRNDKSLRRLICEAHSEVRSAARYESLLESVSSLYCGDGFERVCADYSAYLAPKYEALIDAVRKFKEGFPATSKKKSYDAIFDEMITALTIASASPLFAVKPPLTITRKPADREEEKPFGEEFKKFKDSVAKRYAALCGDFADEQTERERFMASGQTAVAFSDLLLEFDREYAAIKAEENKLDYNDLEHLALRLLSDEAVRAEINDHYRHVFVDEYQDVNPVQEEIISSLSGETFLVGDVKQAIYGFRGSKSVFFSKKFKGFESGGGNALKLSSNFRSADGILDFVNRLFSDIMRTDTCGIDYKNTSEMQFGGLYPAGNGSAKICVFGKDERERGELGVYSVAADGRKSGHTREGLAVLAIVEKELQSKHYDLKTGELRDTCAGDICILTRKNRGGSAEGIVRALTDEGYSVSGAQEPNICNLPEVRQMLDILSLIDNSEQDIPLVTALLSPLGGLSEDELAEIRIAVNSKKSSAGKGASLIKTFRECCAEYSVLPGTIAGKLNIFYGVLEELRSLAAVLNAGELINELLENYGLETGYGIAGEQKVKNVLRLADEGADLPLCAFLEKLKVGGYEVSAPAAARGGSIKIMSMHASKGLEFPVVIIADICRTFKGADYSELPFDEDFGFAPKCFDTENLLAHKTVLRRLAKLRSDNEELKNEFNLFYVACTRAMCRLYILAEEVRPFDGLSVGDAKCYADFFDMSKFSPSEILPHSEFSPAAATEAMLSESDNEISAAIERFFAKPYGYADSVDLPVKSSASAILKMGVDEPRFVARELFGGEGEITAERGIAYHRFLELCDFAVKDKDGISKEIAYFGLSGKMTAEAIGLLRVDELSQILNMPAFDGLDGAELFREREFLCRIPANEIMDTEAEDYVLVQGAIDLMATGPNGVKIIDYKYSSKTDDELKMDYFKQLNLYKKAVATILKINESTITAVIINIRSRRQIDIF